MSSVTTPATTVFGKTTFRGGIVSSAPDTATEALKLIGASQGIGPIRQSYDAFGQPIEILNNAGGLAISGDRISVFGGSDIFNPIFRVLGNAADNLSTTAGGFQVGHSTGVVSIYYGIGAPGAAHPVTSGIPANGTFYYRNDGGVGTSLYQVRSAAWAGIL